MSNKQGDTLLQHELDARVLYTLSTASSGESSCMAPRVAAHCSKCLGKSNYAKTTGSDLSSTPDAKVLYNLL